MKPSVPPAPAQVPTMQDIVPVKTELVAPIPVRAAPGSVPGVNPMVSNPVAAAKAHQAPELKTDKHLDKVLKDVNQTVKDPKWMQKSPGRFRQNLNVHTAVPIVMAFLVGAVLIAAAIASFRPAAEQVRTRSTSSFIR
jgi:hypothetical protein